MKYNIGDKVKPLNHEFDLLEYGIIIGIVAYRYAWTKYRVYTDLNDFCNNDRTLKYVVGCHTDALGYSDVLYSECEIMLYKEE